MRVISRRIRFVIGLKGPCSLDRLADCRDPHRAATYLRKRVNKSRRQTWLDRSALGRQPSHCNSVIFQSITANPPAHFLGSEGPLTPITLGEQLFRAPSRRAMRRLGLRRAAHERTLASR